MQNLNSFNIKLINLCKEYTFLYDVDDKRYSDNELRESAWNTIAKHLKCSEGDCKRAWTLLRDSYRRSLRKRMIQMETGSGVLKKWKYDEEMSFLLPYLKQKPIRKPIYKFDGNYDSDTVEIESNAPSPPGSNPFEIIHKEAPSASSSFVAAQPWQIENEETFANSSSSFKFQKRSDDVDFFFAGLCATVKNFPLKDRAIAKAKVFKVISEMEIDILNRTTESNVQDSVQEADIKNEFVYLANECSNDV